MSTQEEQGAAAEPTTSRFTAVNGKERPTSSESTIVVNGNGAPRRGSDERANGQPRITPPGQEKLTITTTNTQREDWNAASNGERHPYQSTSYSDADGSHKRKRSPSIEQNSSSANSYHSHALPSSTKETPTTATTESDGPREESGRSQAQSDNRDSYSAEAHYRQFIASTEDSRDSASASDPWHSRHYAQPTPITSDEHLGEVLQRASQNLDSHHNEYASPGDDDRSANPYHPYSNREMSAQSDLKKRKRNFSNRTKTGCMTCRRRKKKCDENRPECKCYIDHGTNE